MNKLILVILAIVLISSQAFRTRSKDLTDDALTLQQDLMDWAKAEASTVEGYASQFDPAGYAAAKKFIADFMAASASLQAQFMDQFQKATQFVQAAVATATGK